LSCKTTLYREVRGKVRYYSLALYPTLFNEFLLVREFGGIKNKKPTRIIKEYFSHMEDAVFLFDRISSDKKRKGYSLLH